MLPLYIYNMYSYSFQAVSSVQTDGFLLTPLSDNIISSILLFKCSLFDSTFLKMNIKKKVYCNLLINNPTKQIILLDGVNSHNIFNSTVILLLRPQCYPNDFSEDIYHSFSYTLVLHQSLFAL